jgi:hypothetical protein
MGVCRLSCDSAFLARTWSKTKTRGVRILLWLRRQARTGFVCIRRERGNTQAGGLRREERGAGSRRIPVRRRGCPTSRQATSTRQHGVRTNCGAGAVFGPGCRGRDCRWLAGTRLAGRTPTGAAGGASTAPGAVHGNRAFFCLFANLRRSGAGTQLKSARAYRRTSQRLSEGTEPHSQCASRLCTGAARTWTVASFMLVPVLRWAPLTCEAPTD